MADKKSREKPSQDLRVRAAQEWGKQHKQTTHDAFRDPKFQKAFNKYIEKPSFKTRRDTGLKPKAANRERLELQLIRLLKKFGDTP